MVIFAGEKQNNSFRNAEIYELIKNLYLMESFASLVSHIEEKIIKNQMINRSIILMKYIERLLI